MKIKNHDELVKVIEESFSLKAPFQKATMKFIHNPEAGWNQIKPKDISEFMECSDNAFTPLGVVKTGLCQADTLNYYVMSKTPVTEYIYRVLANAGHEVDKGFAENFWKGVNQEKKAEIIENIAQLIKKSNEEIVSNFINFLEFIN